MNQQNYAMYVRDMMRALSHITRELNRRGVACSKIELLLGVQNQRAGTLLTITQEETVTGVNDVLAIAQEKEHSHIDVTMPIERGSMKDVIKINIAENRNGVCEIDIYTQNDTEMFDDGSHPSKPLEGFSASGDIGVLDYCVHSAWLSNRQESYVDMVWDNETVCTTYVKLVDQFLTAMGKWPDKQTLEIINNWDFLNGLPDVVQDYDTFVKRVKEIYETYSSSSVVSMMTVNVVRTFPLATAEHLNKLLDGRQSITLKQAETIIRILWLAKTEAHEMNLEENYFINMVKRLIENESRKALWK